MLKKGDRSNEVHSIQQKIRILGYNLACDGVFGDWTNDIVISFQKAVELKVDGIVGNKTENKINVLIEKGKIRNMNTVHFKQNEFDCRCCGKNSGIYLALLLNLELVRHLCNDNNIHILSGYRCEQHNIKCGGAPKSYHLYGMAADIVIDNTLLSKEYDVANHVFKGVGKYNKWTHVDIRPKYVRW